MDPAALSMGSQKVIIGISIYFHKLRISHSEVIEAFGVWKDPTTPVTLEFLKIPEMSLQPCKSFIPYALVFGVHWTPIEVKVWFIFYSSMKVKYFQGSAPKHGIF